MADFDYKRPFVQTKFRWSDPWKTQLDLEADAWDSCLAPAISGAQISWKYGDIAPGTGERAQVEEFLDGLVGSYVRIVRPPTDDERHKAVTFEAPSVVLWTGVMMRKTDLAGHDDDDAISMGDEIGNCRGLEILLERSAITGSIVKNADDERVEISTVLPFNIRSAKTGAIKGNRSSDAYAGPSGDESSTSYLFSDTDGEIWTASDVMQYLLVQWGPSNLNPYAFSNTNLENYAEPFGPFSNVRQGLNAVISRARGHAWRVSVGTAGDNEILRVDVYPVFADDVQAEGVNLIGNADTVDLNAEDDRLAGPLQMVDDGQMEFDQVLVEGDPVIIMDTLDMTGSAPTEIEEGWSPAQEVLYEAADDIGRTAKKFSDVYRTFRVTPSQLPAGPTVNDDGTLDTNTTPNQSHLGKKLLSVLPMLKTDDDASGAVEFRKPLIYISFTKGGETVYAPLDDIHASDPTMPNCGIRMVDGEMGFHVIARPNHLLADGTFVPTGGAETDKQPVLDYRNLEATVAWASSERLHVRATIDADANADLVRVKRIRVPGAQCWWRAPSVTTDIVDGARVVETASAELRNDRARLAAIAAMAKAWYAKKRMALTAGFAGIVDDYSVGQIISTAETANWAAQINTIVSRVSYDAVAGRTIVQTAFAELDFVSFANQGAGRPGRIAAPGLTAPDTPAIGAVAVGQEPDNIPAEQGAGDALIISERGKPTAGFTSGTTITLNPVDKDGNDIPNRENVTVYLSASKASVTVTYSTSDVLSFVRFEGNDGTADGVLVGDIAEAASGSVPAGVIFAHAGNSVPSGYLLCDGSVVSQATYADLYAAIGSLWGSDAGGNFTLPDADGVALRGFGTAPFNVVGATGGFPTLTLKHVHTGFCLTVDVNGDGSEDVAWDWNQSSDHNFDSWDGTTSGTVTKPSGANQEVDNRGPWACVKFIIKT